MANLTASVLATGQAIFDSEFTGKGEWRKPEWEIISRIRKGGLAAPSLTALQTGENRTVAAYLPIRTAEGSSTGITVSHTGSAGDSQAKTITYAGFLREEFSISLKRHADNVIDYGTEFAHRLRDKAMNLMTRSKAALIDSMYADRTQYNSGGAYGTVQGASDYYYSVPAAYSDYFFDEIKAMMNKNEYYTSLTVVADTKAQVRARRLGWQGEGNAENLEPQFAGMGIVPTNEDIITGSHDGSVLVFPLDGVAYIPWIPRVNRSQTLEQMNPGRSGADFGHLMLPEIDVPIGIHAYEAKADTSATGGSAQDRVLYVQMFVDWAYVSSPLSTRRGSNDSVVYAALLASS